MVFSFEGGSHLAHGFAHARAQSLLIHAAAHRSAGTCDAALQLLAAMHLVPEPAEVKSVSYSGTATADRVSASIRVFPTSPGEISMVITAAHIQPIVALIAGILILIMPRFLNLVVAIYLIFIGLAGLGLFKMLHT
jgi:hypothetical protein